MCLQQELLQEQHTYLDHLAEQLRKEKEQEREAEKVFKEERDRDWAERVEKMKQEREARFQLLRDVMHARQLQMEEKCKCKHLWAEAVQQAGSSTWLSTLCVTEWTTM